MSCDVQPPTSLDLPAPHTTCSLDSHRSSQSASPPNLQSPQPSHVLIGAPWHASTGLLDVVFLQDGKAYAVGGGGTIFQSTNAGQSWVKDKVIHMPSILVWGWPLRVFTFSATLLVCMHCRPPTICPLICIRSSSLAIRGTSWDPMECC